MPIYRIKNAESSGGGTGTHKKGNFDIPINTDEISLNFVTTMASENYHIDINIKNTEDNNVNGYTWYIKQQTINGFLIKLSNKVNTSNYKVLWKTYIDY